MTPADSDDLLTADLLLKELGGGWLPGAVIHSHAEIDSTNSEAIRLCAAGAPAGTVVTADFQLQGRGRLGRNWISAPRAGLCLSVLLYPSRPRDRWPILTLACGTAVARAVEALRPAADRPGANVALKWPNDLLVGGLKTAGVLLETCGGPGGRHAVVAGIGVNVLEESVPKGLESSAGALESRFGRVPRRKLAAGILRELSGEWSRFELGDDTGLLQAWVGMAPMARDTRVWVIRDRVRREAITRGLTDAGMLRVEYVDGSQEVLLAADVTIRSRE